MSAADANDDERIDTSDAITILRYLYMGATQLPPPGPPEDACGLDPSAPAGSPASSCASYDRCEG